MKHHTTSCFRLFTVFPAQHPGKADFVTLQRRCIYVLIYTSPFTVITDNVYMCIRVDELHMNDISFGIILISILAYFMN